MFKFWSVTFLKIAGLLLALLIFSNISYADINEEEQKEAIDAAQSAMYKQLGIENYLTAYAESLVSAEYRKYIEHIAPIAETIKRQRLELKWDF